MWEAVHSKGQSEGKFFILLSNIPTCSLIQALLYHTNVIITRIFVLAGS